MFPALQYNFSRSEYEPTWKEIIPELAYGVGEFSLGALLYCPTNDAKAGSTDGFYGFLLELFIVFLLGVQSHFRFSKLIAQTRNTSNGKTIVQKLSYFMEMNKILTAALLVDSLSFIILSVDGLTPGMYLNGHKFTADLLICNANLSSLVIWFLVIMIFHPRHGYGIYSSTLFYNLIPRLSPLHIICRVN